MSVSENDELFVLNGTVELVGFIPYELESDENVPNVDDPNGVVCVASNGVIGVVSDEAEPNDVVWDVLNGVV